MAKEQASPIFMKIYMFISDSWESSTRKEKQRKIWRRMKYRKNSCFILIHNNVHIQLRGERAQTLFDQHSTARGIYSVCKTSLKLIQT